MSVVVSMEEVGPCRTRLTVEVPPAALEAETRRVVQEYRRRAKVPGFRKGKVPPGLVKKRFEQEIRQEVIDRLVPRYWRQAEAEKNLQPLLPPEVQSVDLEMDASMTFVATVETRPEIRLGDLEGFDLPEPSVEPTEAEVEQALEDLRRRQGSWEVVDRPAARGDAVAATIVDGEGEHEGIVEVGDERVEERLTLALTGRKAGQEASFRRETPEGSQEVEVRIREVRELQAPPLDDALAAEIADVESVEELREKVTESLRRARERDRARQRESALLEQLRERHPLSLPGGLVERETEKLLREYARDLARQGVDLEKNEIDWGRLAEQVQPQAERMVHSRLLVDAIADERGVEVPEGRLESVLASIARAHGTTPLEVRRRLDASGELRDLRGQLRREETIRRLLGEPAGAHEDTADDETSASEDEAGGEG